MLFHRCFYSHWLVVFCFLWGYGQINAENCNCDIGKTPDRPIHVQCIPSINVNKAMLRQVCNGSAQVSCSKSSCEGITFLHIDGSQSLKASPVTTYNCIVPDGQTVHVFKACDPDGQDSEVPLVCNREFTAVNMALGGIATQSSLYEVRHAQLAVDGNRRTEFLYCTHTDTDDYSPWWMVDLGGIATVHRISMLNRGDHCADRLTNITIHVGRTEDSFELCGVFNESASLSQEVMVQCPSAIQGRHVRITGGGYHCLNFSSFDYPILTLCEVEIHGYMTCGNNIHSHCPSGWIFRACACYYISLELPIQWSHAESDCLERNGYLLEIGSEEESQAVEEILQLWPREYDFWIGATKTGNDGIWRWSYSVGAFPFTNWSPGKPATKNCAKLIWSGDNLMKWEDSYCSWSFNNYICERSTISGIEISVPFE